MAGRNLRSQVAFALFRCSHVVQQQVQNISLHLSAAHDLHWGNSQTLLVDLAAKTHRARIRSSNISMVRTRGYIKIRPFPSLQLYVNRHHQRDVGQVGTAPEGVIEHHHVAWFQRKSLDRRLHRHGNGPKVYRHVISHCNHFACRIKNRTGVITALLDIGRKGGAPERSPHLLGNGVEDILKNFKLNWIPARHSWPPVYNFPQ